MMSIRGKWLLCHLLLAVLFAASAHGQSTESTEEVLKGPTWQLRVPGKDFSATPQLKSFLENAESLYQGLFTEMGLTLKTPRPLKVKVFENQQAYREFQSKNSQSQSPYAFYSLFNSEVYTWPQASSDTLFANLYHEATHHYLRNFVTEETVPRCLDEGVAEMFEAGGAAQGFQSRQMPSNWVEALQKARDQGTTKPFPFFLQMPPRDFINFNMPGADHYQIAQCWGQSYFLIYGDGGRWHGIWKNLVIQSGAAKSADEIIRTSLPAGVTAQEFEERWKQFIKQL